MNAEAYRAAVLARIAKGRDRGAGATTAALVGPTMVKRTGARDEFELADVLRKMRDAGEIVCTNGIWWAR